MTHVRAPQPFILDEDDVLDYESARSAGSELNRRRVDARHELEKAGEARIAAETALRAARAKALVEGKVDGKNAEARKILLEDATAQEIAAVDKVQNALDIWTERLKEIDGQRATLHRLIEWSAQLDPAVAEVWAQRREQRDLMKAA